MRAARKNVERNSKIEKSLKEIKKLSLVRRKRKRKAITAESVGVIGKLRLAMEERNRLATIFGFAFGGLVPFLSWITAHYEAKSFWSVGTLVVAACLVFSSITVYEWGNAAFHNRWKAVGFVVLTEGVMVTSGIWWLSILTLGYLMLINGVGTGVNIALRK